MNGFAGKLLRVNLTTGSTREEPLDDATARAYLGGRGLGAKILFAELAPGIDPLGPENKLVFATGPATGSNLPANARFIVMGKSPLTGVFGEANCSGSFGRELKKAGYDGLIVEGKASRPVYLWIKDGQAEIRDAGHLWGKTTGETEDALKQEVGDARAWVAGIGPAGEKLAKIACVISDKHRAAGRTGMGAVMGSKNLKAIVARGTGEVPVADPARIREVAREMNSQRREDPGSQGMAKFGTSGGIPTLNAQGILPTKNFQCGTFAGFNKISGQALAETILTDTIRCEGCPVPHDRLVDMKDSPYGPIHGEYGGAEYETIAAFGSLCLVDDLIPINVANEMCNAYGIDTISAGVVMAWTMECYEKGILTKADLGGIEAKWGDARAMLALLEKTCRREGIGDILADGVREASRKVGKGSEEFAIHVRGLELAMHEPRGKKGLSLVYTAAGARGASHMEASHDPGFEKPNALPELGIVQPMSRFAVEGKGELIKKIAEVRTVINSLGLCCFILEPAFGRGTIADIAGLLTSLAGWENLTIEEVMAMGERANNLARAFNAREGSDRRDDHLPKRFQEAFTEGGSAGQTISPADMDQMLDDFYAAAGWTKNGVPSRAKLESLGLASVATALEKQGALPGA